MPLGEFDLIRRHFSRPVQRAVLGGGDDCALLAPTPGMQMAISTDTLVEGRHFLSTVRPERLGHKALAVNLSDLAACGAQPLAFTLALTLPRVDEPFLAAFADGLYALAQTHGIELIGGDTTAGPLAIGITVLGEVPPGLALRRSGARLGDDIWVSGQLGDARLALEVFRGQAQVAGDAFEALRMAMEQPTPRVALGLALRGVATSAIDLSDGLSGDIGHVLRASGVGARIAFDAMPRSERLRVQPIAMQQQCLLAGGDDYELLFTAPPSQRQHVQAAGTQGGVRVTRIGRIESDAGLRIVSGQPDDDLAQAIRIDTPRAFDHFATP